MRVLLVALTIFGGEGGIERFNQRLLRSLDELRADGRVHVWRALALHDKGPGTPLPVVAGASSRIRTLLQFTRLLVSSRPTIVFYGHVLLVPLVLLGRLLRPRARHVLLAYGIEVWDPPGRIRAQLIRRGIDCIYAVSTYTNHRMQAAYDLPPAMFELLPPATDLIPRNHASQADRTASGAVLLSVSRLTIGDSYKNIDRVIDALPEVLEDHPRTQYVVVGDGDWRPILEDHAQRLGIGKRVRFTGRVTDAEKEAIYATADVFILPSTMEGFGIVFLEAWSHHLPVIASREGAGGEVIRNGLDGLTVEPDPASIATAITALLANPSLARRMGTAGAVRVRDQYSHEAFRARLAEILEDRASCAE